MDRQDWASWTCPVHLKCLILPQNSRLFFLITIACKCYLYVVLLNEQQKNGQARLGFLNLSCASKVSNIMLKLAISFLQHNCILMLFICRFMQKCEESSNSSIKITRQDRNEKRTEKIGSLILSCASKVSNIGSNIE